MTTTVDIALVGSSARRVRWNVHPADSKKLAFDCTEATRVWLSAVHADGDTAIIEITDTAPSDFKSGKLSCLLTRDNVLSLVGDWQYAVSMLIAGEDIPVAVGTITVTARPNDPTSISGNSAAASSASSSVANP